MYQLYGIDCECRVVNQVIQSKSEALDTYFRLNRKEQNAVVFICTGDTVNSGDYSRAQKYKLAERFVEANRGGNLDEACRLWKRMKSYSEKQLRYMKKVCH